MRKPGLVLVLLLTCALAAGVTGCGDFDVAETTTTMEDDLTTVVGEDEQTIYSVFMDDSNGKTVVVREETLPDTLPQSDEEARHYIGANLQDVSGDTLDNYLHVNSDSIRLPSTMDLGVRYLLISTPEFREITGDPEWREIWRQRYPDSEVTCISFSRIGFNRSYTQALVYVMRLWVDGGYYLLELEEGTWKITDSFSNVLIN